MVFLSVSRSREIYLTVLFFEIILTGTILKQNALIAFSGLFYERIKAFVKVLGVWRKKKSFDHVTVLRAQCLIGQRITDRFQGGEGGLVRGRMSFKFVFRPP